MNTYITTNQNNEYWTGKKFNKEELIDEENTNYQFVGFSTPEEAKFFNSVFQNIPEIQIWECEQKELTSKNWLYSTYKSILPLRTCDTEELTDLQYAGMAIIGIMNVIENNNVRCFCFDYLRDNNRKPETADKLYKKLSEYDNNYREGQEYFGPVWSFLNGIIKSDYKKYCAISLYRSICDSYCIESPLNFKSLYNTVKKLSLEEIAEKIKSKTIHA